MRYLITPSLLNSWLYIDLCSANVREAEADTECLEDKILAKQEKTYLEFLDTLERKPHPTTHAQQMGIDFEASCYRGETEVSPIIEGGTFQAVGTRKESIGGIDFLLYGRLDVLKDGVIYDIKRVSRYEVGKYVHSAQHMFYLTLFPKAKYFEYLAWDGAKLHRERYFREDCIPTETLIANFMDWLEAKNLMEVYKANWQSKEER